MDDFLIIFLSNGTVKPETAVQQAQSTEYIEQQRIFILHNRFQCIDLIAKKHQQAYQQDNDRHGKILYLPHFYIALSVPFP